MYGGTCSEYELPGNEAWCEGYGDHGEEGQTPNENCCFCQGKVCTRRYDLIKMCGFAVWLTEFSSF